jgi:prephenate dehydratase
LHFLPIRFQLMANKGTTLAGLKTVQSHVMALGQCRKIIRKLGLKAEVAADTAGSARAVAESGDLTRAAIAPRLAASIYGLDILKEDIEDEKHNTTRFVILSKYPEYARVGAGTAVTTLVFRVRNLPAALYKALGGFATNGINMTKLESYMLDGHFSATMFYLDVEGHPDDPALGRALDELSYFSREVKILGVYGAHPYRKDNIEPAE